MFKVSSFAVGLLADNIDDTEIEQRVAGMHPTMRDEGRRLLKARAEAARMMSGLPPYDSQWRSPFDGSGYDPQQIDIHADRLVSACGHISDMAPYPRAVVGELLETIAGIDSTHPLVQNWKLLADACTGMDETAPAWGFV